MKTCTYECQNHDTNVGITTLPPEGKEKKCITAVIPQRNVWVLYLRTPASTVCATVIFDIALSDSSVVGSLSAQMLQRGEKTLR
jgi:hypothetical protein